MYPEHPDTIIIQNEFYPNGLKEIDIWNYYQKNKNFILRETIGKDLMLFIATDLNEFIVRRRSKETPYIKLNPSNYDNIITGRTLSIHSTMEKTTYFGIIDIDIEDFKLAKEATKNVYEYIKNAPFVDRIKIRFTGSTSFHLILNFKRILKIEYVNELIREYLEKENFENYTIKAKRTKGIVNLDLGRNIYKAGYITLHSLSVFGLKCMEVDINQLKNFNKDRAKIGR